VADTPETSGENGGLRQRGAPVTAPNVDEWFVREVLPLEPILMQFLRRNWNNKSDITDLCQDVYVRVYEAARKQIPETAKSFVFATARNLLIDHFRRGHVVSIDAVADLEMLGVGIDESAAPDRVLMAREELRRLQTALDRLPARCREAVILRQIEGLSRREVAARMGVAEETVKRHLAAGAFALADMLYGEPSDLGKAK
jgi:RNA polymerase sigma factor (sigma-70 family)